MAGMTKTLQILPVGEPGPVSAVRLHMVHIGGRRSDTAPGALPAERLPQELRGPEIIQPYRRSVHPAPGLSLRAAPAAVFRPVFRTPAVTGQRTASWMPARSERLHCHGLSPPGKIKTPDPTTQPSSGESLALAFNALAFFDIKD